MKTCPHCKASLEDEAHFCLYCMTSLEHKKVINAPERRQRAPLWIVAILLLAAISVTVAVWQPWAPVDTVPLLADTTTAAFQEATATQTTVPTTAPTYSVGNPVYTYRTAERLRDYAASANVAEDAIVITGIAKPSSDGIYVIPDNIDGHRVYKVDGLAFSDEAIRDTVQTVVFSASVRMVEDYAFAACTNLTDVYYCGKSIFISPFAYPDPQELANELTIHCASDCQDGRFRYHKNQDVYAYEEWNGGELS